MRIQTCPECSIRVAPMQDGRCPSCSKMVFGRLESSDSPSAAAAKTDSRKIECKSCGQDLTGAVIGGNCPNCGMPTSESLSVEPSPQIKSAPKRMVTRNLDYVGPILVSLFCCSIGGIVAIVYTAKANEAAADGSLDLYLSAKSTRDGWLIFSVLIGILVVFVKVAMMASQ